MHLPPSPGPARSSPPSPPAQSPHDTSSHSSDRATRTVACLVCNNIGLALLRAGCTGGGAVFLNLISYKVLGMDGAALCLLSTADICIVCMSKRHFGEEHVRRPRQSERSNENMVCLQSRVPVSSQPASTLSSVPLTLSISFAPSLPLLVLLLSFKSLSGSTGVDGVSSQSA